MSENQISTSPESANPCTSSPEKQDLSSTAKSVSEVDGCRPPKISKLDLSEIKEQEVNNLETNGGVEEEDGPASEDAISGNPVFQRLIAFMHAKYQEQIVSTLQGTTKFADIIEHWHSAFQQYLDDQKQMHQSFNKLKEENASLREQVSRLSDIQELQWGKIRFWEILSCFVVYDVYDFVIAR